MKKFIVFDLDGTLLDTLVGITSAVNKCLKYFNYPYEYDYDTVKTFIGNGARKLFLLATKKETYDEELNKQYIKMCEFYEQEQYVSKPYPEVIQTLKELQKRGIKLFIYSNKPEMLLNNVVKALLKDIHFDKIIGQNDAYPCKPDVTRLNETMKEYDLSHYYGLYVGDSLTDFATANNAQLDFIFVKYGYSKKEDENKIFGTCVSKFSEILDHIK